MIAEKSQANASEILILKKFFKKNISNGFTWDFSAHLKSTIN